MSTETKPEVKAGWSVAEEAVIAHFVEKMNMTRSNAVRKMRTLAAKGIAPEHMIDGLATHETARVSDADVDRMSESEAKTLLEPKKAKRAKAAAHRNSLSVQKWNALDEAARKAVGKGCAIDTVYKSSLSSEYSRYVWYGVSDGRVLSINPDSMESRFLDPASKSAKGWQRQQARKLKREEKAAVKADNKAAKEAQAKAK